MQTQINISTRLHPVEFSPGVWILGSLFVMYRLVTSLNPLEELYAYLVLGMIIRLLWNRGVPPVFLFISSIHWLQIYMFLVWNNFYGWRVNTYYSTGGDAFWLSMTGVGLMTLIFHQILKKTAWANADTFNKESFHFSSVPVFWAYIFLTVFNGVLFQWAVTIPSIGQILFWMIDLREVMLLFYAWLVMVKKEPKWGLIFLCLIHFVLSLTSYFGGYKSVFILLALLIAMRIRYVNLFRMVAVIMGLAFFLFLSSIWLSVRNEYRIFLNRGTKMQVVKVSRQESLQQLYLLVSHITPHQLYKGFENMIYRIQYLQYFSLAMQRVPNMIPYQQGNLTLSNLEFVLVPRILDPDKPTLDASRKTIRYTGAQVATAQEGTSISMGYFVDFYIDFGSIGMFFPLILFWLLIGWSYQYFVRHLSFSVTLNAMVMMIFLKRFYLFETDAIGMIGGLYTMLITLVLLRWFLMPVLMRLFSYKLPHAKRVQPA
ncbi:hypothetical protein BXY57_0248 [Thermoflavifilum aggregans]|uniref:Oligosaccharide repeat unit polymerase n=1 Tax=Thermoflavifilum aggregans TaxID=454188 RepID=A0A2M9CRW3_9BACT|nr:hypothetical protein [Thermoflavifilum aggregans]PJJ74686.1 hypothetical protein BXY57_0248 [Thermoflavifilum aggregans]